MIKNLLHYFLSACFIMGSSYGVVFSNPVVNAGDDQLSVSMNLVTAGSLKLIGDVSGASDSMSWKQISGPTALISNVLDPITPVTMADTGKFIFVLRAYYLGTTYSDTTIITVRPGLPFVVLAPVNNAQIEIGKPFVVRWQMDPPAGCAASYSIDGGKNFVPIGTGAGKLDSITWNVDPTLIAGTTGIIQVADYATKRKKTTATFVLVEQVPQAIKHSVPKLQNLPFTISLSNRSSLMISGLAFLGKGSLIAMDARGKIVVSEELMGNNEVVFRNIKIQSNVLVYRITTNSGKIFSGSLVLQI